MKKALWVSIFIFLSCLLVIIFFYRSYFNYTPYKTYSQLYATCDAACIKKWSAFIKPYPKQEITEANKIVQDSLHLNVNESTITRVEKIAGFVYRNFHQQQGIPDSLVCTFSPLQQYKRLTRFKNEKLWCGIYADMFAFFCWSQNIVCRYVEVFNPGDHHVLNECYIPELQKWIMVDVMHNLLNVQNKNRVYLNVQDFQNAINEPGELAASMFLDSTIILMPINKQATFINIYYRHENPYYYFHHISLSRAYSLGQKIKQYFLPISWYEIYSGNRKSNFLFWLREFFFLAWLVSGLMIVGIFIKRKL